MFKGLKNKLKGAWTKAATGIGLIEPDGSRNSDLTSALCQIRDEKNGARIEGRPVNEKKINKLRAQARDFIAKGENLDHQNFHRQDAVYLSLMAKEPMILWNLINAGADLNQYNHSGQTPLDVSQGLANSDLLTKEIDTAMHDQLVKAGAKHSTYYLKQQEEKKRKAFEAGQAEADQQQPASDESRATQGPVEVIINPDGSTRLVIDVTLRREEAAVLGLA